MMNLLVIFSILAALNVNMVLSRRYFTNRQASPDCRFGKGTSYRGMVSVSSYGNRCLKWSNFWDDSNGVGNHNYCRNPNNRQRPWCYVKKRWQVKKEFCDIPRCPKVTAKPTTTPRRVVDTERTCGEGSERRTNKIVGGSFVPIESQPWIAAIFQKTFLCGGSLIAPGWVLTAAHCFLDGNQTSLQRLKVYLGKSDIKSTDPDREQPFSVEKLIIHQKYNPSNFDNDIALLKISNANGQGALKTASVRTVCLPPLNTYLPDGVTCSIAGFGKESSSSWSYSNRLKQATVRLLSSTNCKVEESYKALLTDNMMCAASLDWSTDSCKGDSGGPLVCEASGRMFLFGVVSWGEGCASKNKPGVYTKVTHYNDWIADKTGLSEYTKGLMYPQK
ncbi:urokinase-type plasminogen activator [Poecilia reticulata]|uniref:urokinase-type plasminogen activator n=1 Tax=Poecilia reticulata TaxID=8081 RepID=UPI0004A337F1|nr:PREDICTED: urokinase-type plasminogen activator [Poecilia reticulata]